MNENVRKILNSEEGNVKFQAIDFLLERNYIKMEELEDYYAQKSNSFFLEAFWERYQKNINLERCLDLAIKYENNDLILLLAREPKIDLNKLKDYLFKGETRLLIKFAENIQNIKSKAEFLNIIVKKVVDNYLQRKYTSWMFPWNGKMEIEEFFVEMAKVPSVNFDLIKKAVLKRCRNGKVILKLAIIRNEYVNEFEDLFLKCEMETNDIYADFANKVPNANIKKIEDFLINSNKCRSLLYFVSKVPSANLKRVVECFINLSKKSSDRWRYFRDDFSNLATIASWYENMECVNMCAKEIVDISKEHLAINFKEHNLDVAKYLVGIFAPLIDLKLLADVLLDTHAWYEIIDFMDKHNCMGMDIKKLEKMMCDYADTHTIVSFMAHFPDIDCSILAEELYKRPYALSYVESQLRAPCFSEQLKEMCSNLKAREFNTENFIENVHELSKEKLDEMFLNEEQKLVRTQKKC